MRTTLFLWLSILLTPIVIAQEKPNLEIMIKHLSAVEFPKREIASQSIVSHFNDHPSSRWIVGKTLQKKRAQAPPEVRERIAAILDQIKKIEPVRWLSPKDHEFLVGPGWMDGKARIGDAPILIVIITSKKMFRFYRPVAQNTVGLKVPKIDFTKNLLVGVSTSKKESIISASHCIRDFKNSTSLLSVTLNSDGLNPNAKGSVGYTYYLSKYDLPLSLLFSKSAQNRNKKRAMLIEFTELGWNERKRLLLERNIIGLRKIAENCDGETPQDARRRFLSQGLKIDPLLPYVYFSHIAKESPEVFKKDFNYWKSKIPDGVIVGKLFKAALNEGLGIVKKGVEGKVGRKKVGNPIP